MKIVDCELCGNNAPEGFNLCPPCVRIAGMVESEISAAGLMDIANIVNMTDTGESQRAAIGSILNIVIINLPQVHIQSVYM